MIAIIDYDAGNIKSVEKALTALGEKPVTSREADIILSADKVVLPGVGSFGDAMRRLNQYGLVDVIHQAAAKEIPILGICLGLQLMFDRSDETDGVPGLGLIPGEILKIPSSLGRKVPHMGWNSLEVKSGSKLLQGVKTGSYVYFVHSYYLKAKDENIVSAVTHYGVPVHAAVERGCLYACQFHPEKSSEVGLKILENFVRL